MRTLFGLALRNLTRNRRRTAITLAALIMGVGVTVIIKGFVNGMQASMSEQVVTSSTGALQVHRTGYMKNVLSTPLSLAMKVDDGLLDRIRSTDGVTAAAPRLMFSGMVNVGDDTLFLAATGLDPVAERQVCPQRWNTFAVGAVFEEPASVLLTQDLLAAVNAKQGGEAVMLAPDKDGSLNAELLKLSGGFWNGGIGEAKVGVIPFSLAQRLLRMEGEATEVVVSVKDVNQAPAIAAALRQKLGNDFEVHTWDEVFPLLKEGEKRRAAMLALITAIFMLLTLLGVANTLLMSVMERTREIGTMMAVGVKRSWIMGLFLTEALLLGAFGSGFGALLGTSWNVYEAHKGISFVGPMNRGGVPFDIHPFTTPGYVLTLMAVASFGAVIAAIYPAFRASRLRPVQALANQ